MASGSPKPTPFWWLGDARQLLTYHVDTLVPVFEGYLRDCMTEEMPLHTAMDRAAFVHAFHACPAFSPAAIAAFFERFKNDRGVVDIVQVGDGGRRAGEVSV